MEAPIRTGKYSVSLLTVILLTAALAQSLHGQAVEPKTAEQSFKNIVQLKGTAADQVGPAMQFIASSLGVESRARPDGPRRQAGQEDRPEYDGHDGGD